MDVVPRLVLVGIVMNNGHRQKGGYKNHEADAFVTRGDDWKEQIVFSFYG
jgi:hypothetical protein